MFVVWPALYAGAAVRNHARSAAQSVARLEKFFAKLGSARLPGAFNHGTFGESRGLSNKDFHNESEESE
jgi:hypothetical protein